MPESSFDISAKATRERIKREKGSPITCRDWDSYPFIFLLKDKPSEFWKGKLILDVGSGEKWRDPENAFPGAKVCAIDPEFEIPQDPEFNFGRIPWNTAHETRLGVVQEIPYDDNQFDFVLSSHAVPQHIFPVYMPRAISEMVRVMKPSGEIRLAPCVKSYGIADEWEKALREAGFEINYLKGGTDGTVTVIKAGEKINKSIELKDKAWRELHLRFFPKEDLK